MLEAWSSMKKGLLKQFPKQIREKNTWPYYWELWIKRRDIKTYWKKPKIHNQNLFKRRRTSGFARRKRFWDDWEQAEIRSKLWMAYYEFKKAVKENMDELVRDIAESFCFFNTVWKQVWIRRKQRSNKGLRQIQPWRLWETGDFFVWYGLVTENTDDYLEIDRTMTLHI